MIFFKLFHWRVVHLGCHAAYYYATHYYSNASPFAELRSTVYVVSQNPSYANPYSSKTEEDDKLQPNIPSNQN